MTILRCPHCGGEVAYDPDAQMIKCEYCDSVITAEDYRNYLDSRGLFSANELVCRQCGAKIISTENTIATFCSFCGSPLTLDGNLTEVKKPDYIIPFKVKKSTAVKNYKDRIHHTLMAPDWMKEEGNIEKFRGIYMPFHLFRYTGDGIYSGKAYNTGRSYEKGVRYDVFNTYQIDAPVDIDYDLFPADASASFPDPMSMTLSPYRVRNMVGFEIPYLAGYYADGKDVPAEVYDPKYGVIAHNDIGNESNLRTGGMTVEAKDVVKQIPIERDTSTALFPVWFLSFRNRDKVSYAAVNGDTGELAVDIPIDFRKYLAGSVIVAGILSLVLNLLFTITPAKLMTIASVLSAVIFLVADRLLNDSYRQAKHLDDPGYTGEDVDKAVIRKPSGKVLNVIGAIVTGIVGFFLLLILLMIFAPESTLLLGLSPVVMIMYIVTKCAIAVSGGIVIKRRKAPGYYKFLTLIKPVIAVLGCAYAAVTDINNDMLCYAAGLISILMIILTAFDVVRVQNRLTMRDLPVFTEKRGGDV